MEWRHHNGHREAEPAARSLAHPKQVPEKPSSGASDQTLSGPLANSLSSMDGIGSAASALSGSGLLHPTAMRPRANLFRALQTSRGNAFVQRTVRAIDAEARQPQVIQRQCACGGTCEECKQGEENPSSRPLIQTSRSHGPGSTAVKNSVIPSHSHGAPLERATRNFMEPRFGRDLSDVRVHTDSSAAQSAEVLNASAYTLGHDVYFGAGKYSPDSREGQRLLAHEITHTVQQSQGAMPAGVAASRNQDIAVGRIDDPMEAEAGSVADSVVNSPAKLPAAVSADRSPAVRGNWLGDAWDSVKDAGAWVGGKVKAGGEAVVEGAEWVGHEVKEGAEWVGGKAEEAGSWAWDKATAGAEWIGGEAKAVGKWALGKLEKAWECAKATGHAAANLVTGNISSVADLLGIPEPAGKDPSTLDTIVTVLKHPCLQMIPGYGLVAGGVKVLERVGSFLVGAWHVIENPQPLINEIQTSLSKLISAIPAQAEALVQKALKNVGAKLKEHGEGVWRHLEPKLEYLAKNWWDVIKQTAWTLIWPWPAVKKDLSEVWDHVKSAASNLWHLNFSKAIDDILAVEHGVISIVGSLYGWFVIAAVLVGAILGGIFGVGAGAIPGAAAGFELAMAVGEGLVAATVIVETASIAKAAYDLLATDESQDEKEKDYEQIASSGLTLAITGVMFVLGELAVKFAQGLFSRVAGLFKAKPPEVAIGEPAVTTPEVKGPKVEGTPDKTPTAEIDTPQAAKTQDLPELEQKAHTPNQVHAVEDPALSGQYDAEIDVGEHAYRRSKADGTWCRFSDPLCGIDLKEINSDVDTALAPKPEELPPEIAAETPAPGSPEAVSTEATPVKSGGEAGTQAGTELEPGTPAHKSARWAEYQARGGKWKYERWSNVYDRNMVRARIANEAADAYHQQLGWGKREQTIKVEGVDRRLDIADVETSRGIEVKSGKQYLTQDNAWEILRDKILVDQGWSIEWHFTERPSQPLLKALEDAKIKYTGP